MPKGPFGFRRPFGLGPFSYYTDEERFIRRVRRISDGDVDVSEVDGRKVLTFNLFGVQTGVLEVSVIVLERDGSGVNHAQLRTKLLNSTNSGYKQLEKRLERETKDVIDDKLPHHDIVENPSIDGVRGNKAAVRVESIDDEGIKYKVWSHLAFGKTDYETAANVVYSFKSKIDGRV